MITGDVSYDVGLIHTHVVSVPNHQPDGIGIRTLVPVVGSPVL